MSKLADELTTDPLGRGYAALSDAEVAADLMTAYRTRPKTMLDSAEIYEAIDVAEFQSKTDAQRVYVRDILGLGGNVRVGTGSKARAVFVAVFGAGSNTIAALAAALVEPITRAEELELGTVKAGHIEEARRNG